MKYISFLTLLFCGLLALPTASAQAPLDNGRPVGVTAQPTPSPEPAANKGGQDEVVDDQDIPGSLQRRNTVDVFFPTDLTELQQNIDADAATLEALTDAVNTMRQAILELRDENDRLSSSLRQCCNNSGLLETARDAYLVQNAPNPAGASTEIRYYIPQGLRNVSIELHDVKGQVLQSIPVRETGYGSYELRTAALSSGSYVYALLIDGKKVDSKVMVIQ